MRHYVRLSRMNYAIDAGLYPLGSCTMKHNPRLNEKMARLPGFGDLHPLQPQQTMQGALALISRIDALADDADRHAGRRHVAQGGRAWRIVRPADDPRGARSARREPHAHPGAVIGARHQSRDGGACRLHGRRSAREARRPCRCRCAEGQARPRCRRDHADQSQHLRLVRAARSRKSPTQCTRRAPISIATARISTPSRAACVRAISASTPCISICTRRSPRRMAAADRARGRWCCRRRWRLSRRCRCWCMTTRASA